MNEELQEAIHKTSIVFEELIKKLEEDKYISCEMSFSRLLMEELEELAYRFSLNQSLAIDEDGNLIIPGGFLALGRFDRMAQEYSGAFWQRLNVTNPGRLTDMYLDLLEAKVRLLLSNHQEEVHLPTAFSLASEQMRVMMESPYFD